MKRMAVLAVAGLAALTQCKSPFDLANDAAATGQPFSIKATVGGAAFSAGGTCVVQPGPSGQDVMTVSASQVMGITTRTITFNIVAPTGQTVPFTASLGTGDNVGAVTEGNGTSYSTEGHPGSGSVVFTHWQSNANGSGYAEGTFSFTGYTGTNQTMSVTGGSIRKN